MNIPADWTFDGEEITKNFDSHVREQLPWYDLATEAVSYIVRNYLPENGVVIDIGASTGNMVDKLMPLIQERKSEIYAVETSQSMFDLLSTKYQSKSKVFIKNDDFSICNADVVAGDVYILFLTMMFVPVAKREQLIENLTRFCNKGGVIIVVDKILDHSGYFGTVMKRLGMHFKVTQKVNLEDILKKELSLAGVQIPIDSSVVDGGKMFFRMGEFAGWVIEV
jgi:tRNA (cmo5U34)-methyltransferase